MTWVPSVDNPGNTVFGVPGRFAGKWFESYNSEVLAHNAWTTQFGPGAGNEDPPTDITAWEAYNT